MPDEKYMSVLIKSALFVATIYMTCFVHAQPVKVHVGGYLFPPFVQVHNNEISGLTLDLIDLFNKAQSDYEFTFVLTSPKRRYSDFERGDFDVMFFENKKWSWQEFNIDESQVFLSGGEVFIAKVEPGRDQSFFDDLEHKNLVAILGYHYHFANNITDIKELNEKFNIRLVNSPEIVINQIINNKSEIGIATYSYLQRQIKLTPKLKETLLISNHFDQVYEHRILVRSNHQLNIKTINALLNQVKRSGELQKLLNKYGLTPLS